MNMQQVIKNFLTKGFNEASQEFFKYLNVPINKLIEDSIDINNLFGENKVFSIVDATYMIGGVDNNVFEGREGYVELKPQRYDGLLIFAINLNITNPTRAQLSNISRIFNRKFEYTPVVILFKYNNQLSLSSTQRQEYSENQKWRDGEKVGKVSILRDIEIDQPHRGHIDILEKMKLTTDIKSFEDLYLFWQEVFDVSVLNKKFYQELQNWYLYAINEVIYPNQPKRTDPNYTEELRKEYVAKNIIRLLTRILFVWFIKEKGLIPSKLFEENEIKNILKEFDPKKVDNDTLFAGQDKRSFYYKAILQNLFFATLNQEMGKREFRKDKQHQNISNLMRYKNYFNNPDDFIDLVEKVVPFMNGGLFECLDSPHPTKQGQRGGSVIEYEDGFSDRDDNILVVPDYIFFGLTEHVDLSVEYGSQNKAFKNASVKGLINILNSYKFTVAENTPIEEDVALDPELLGKVFENLLASYNPETKTTARKQTGSFYTPREIVSYMVDKSLVAYLKTQLADYEDKEDLDRKLHILIEYNDIQPFNNEETILKIINAIDSVKILDPAVGSGAFPMGTLQKMVHLLHKLDPDNKHWFNLQFEKVTKETNEIFQTKDKQQREDRLKEINDAFDIDINHPDYARKLYLIENTIFGIDIQPIAIQISKLRFFISLVIEQNVSNDKPNFGIRPLPNLESKFVSANTLVGIDTAKHNLFDTNDIKELELQLKLVRHKMFNAKSKDTKYKYKEKDRELREQISVKLVKNGLGNDTAKQLSSWNPYDQNTSNPFFDPEWMFGIENGFDIVIGNPPYIDSESMVKNTPEFREQLKKTYETAKGNWDIFVIFIERSIKLTKLNGCTSLIVPNKLISAKYTQDLRTFMNEYNIVELIDYSYVNVFTEADVYPIVFRVIKNDNKDTITTKVMNSLDGISSINFIDKNIFSKDIFWDKYFFDKNTLEIIIHLSNFKNISSYSFDVLGAATVNEAYQIKEVITEQTKQTEQNDYLKFINTGTIDPYESLWGKKNTQYIKGAYTKPIVSIESLKSINRVRYEQAISPKIIIAGMANRIEAFLDEGNYLAGKSTTIILGDNCYLKILTAILNSSIVSFWFSKYYNSLSMSGGYFNMGRNEISSIPIPNILNIDIAIFNIIVDSIVFLKTKKTNFDNVNIIIKYFERIMNGLIFELYYENHMTDHKINILEYITKDIRHILKNKDFDTLDETEKINIIDQLYTTWTYPDNEVRNRIKLFAVRSPNILRQILEA